jgi:hypothetical protein
MLENLNLKIEGNMIKITVDLSQEGRLSKNQYRKTIVFASSNGMVPLVNPDGTYRRECLNFSIWRKAEPGELVKYGHYDRAVR